MFVSFYGLSFIVFKLDKFFESYRIQHHVGYNASVQEADTGRVRQTEAAPASEQACQGPERPRQVYLRWHLFKRIP